MKKEGREQKQFVVNIITLVIVAFLASMLNEQNSYAGVSGQAVNQQKAFTSRGFDNQHTEEWSALSNKLSNYRGEDWKTNEKKSVKARFSTSTTQTITGIILFVGSSATIIKTDKGTILTAPKMPMLSVGEKVKIEYQYNPAQNEINVLNIWQI